MGCGMGATAAFALSAQAQNLLVNGSFESASQFTANPITTTGPGYINAGWGTYNDAAQSNMGSSPDFPEDGSYALLETQASTQSWSVPGAFQITAPVGGIIAGDTYQYSGYYLSDANPIQGVLAGPQFGFRQVVGTTYNEVGTDVNLPGYWTALTSANTWIPFSMSEVAPVGATSFIVYAQLGGGKVGTVDLYYDNLSVVIVPEPTSLALVAMGLAAVPFYFRRQRKS